MSAGLSIVGIDPTKTRTSAEGAEFKVGTRGAALDSTDGSIVKEYVYVVNAAVAQVAGDVNAISVAGVATKLTSTNAAAGQSVGRRIGVAVSAIPASGFGWLQIYGLCTVAASAATAIFTELNATATAGALTSGVGAGTFVVNGIVLTTAAGGASVVAGQVNYPFVGLTHA